MANSSYFVIYRDKQNHWRWALFTGFLSPLRVHN